MTKEKAHNIRLGIFVFAGLVLLIIGLYSIGRNRNMFGSSIRVYCVFYDVNGLIPGDNVRYAGINVGSVDKIKIVNDSAVRVEMIIDDKNRKFIRTNSVASIATDGLMGNKLVSISVGSTNERTIENNDELPTLKAVNTEAMLRTLDMTNDNIAVITTNLWFITDNVNKSRGALYAVLNDTMGAQRVNSSLRNIELVSNNLVTISSQLETVVNNINSGRGLLGTMISDTTVSNDLKQSIEKIRNGSEEFSKITEDISAILKEVHSGNGVITALLKDTIMAGDLKSSMSNLETATVTLNEELEALKQSFLLRPFYKKKK